MTSQLLTDLRAMLAFYNDDPDRWTKGSFWRNAAGQPSNKEDVCSACMLGAARMVTPSYSGRCSSVMLALQYELPYGSFSIAEFNDNILTSFEDALDLIKAAIMRAEEAK